MNATHIPRATPAPAAPVAPAQPKREAPAPATPGLPLFLHAALQPKLAINPPGDEFERAADAAADTVRPASAGARAPGRCACGGALGPDGECAACKQKRGGLQRSAAGEGGGATAPSSVHTALRGAGQPLDGAARGAMEAHFDEDFGSVRVHTGHAAGESAQAIRARAYTVGDDVVFAPGQYQPHTQEGGRLLAHELAHVVQQGAGGGPKHIVQRDGDAPPPNPEAARAKADGAAAVADKAASAAGPCGVDAQGLSNTGLLSQLNRARVYLTQTKRGEGEFYDYANLLRRLSAERHTRIRSGQVWLAETGLLAPPTELYSLEPSGPLQLAVRRVQGTLAAGAFAGGQSTLMTREQFQRFLDRNNVPVVDMMTHLASLDPASRQAATVNMPPQVRKRLEMIQPAFSPFGGTVQPGQPAPFGLPALGPQQPPGDPFGLWGQHSPFPQIPGAQSPLPPYRTVTSIASAGELLNDTRVMPSLVGSGGPERVFLPRPSAPVSTGGQSYTIMQPGFGDSGMPFAQPGFGGGPSGVGALGFLGRPSLDLGGTTGVMWEGNHAVDVAMLNDRLFTRGFRAPMPMHVMDKATGHNSTATAKLNVGTPGSYANDATYGYTGGLFGKGAVIIVRADGTPVDAAQLMELMAQRGPAMEGKTYQFSPPKEGSAAWKAADVEARKQGMTSFCPAGGQNCINVPIDIHQQALGGADLKFTNTNGVVIDLGDPAHASAKNMSEFMNQPDSFFEARGLRKVNIGQQMWKGVGVAGGLGAGLSLGSDAWRYAQGDQVSFGDAAKHAAISGGSSAVSVVAEDYAYNFAANQLLSRGVSAGAASTLGRFGASTGVAVVVAPITTGLEMYFDDREYTNIDYAARMSRSGVAAGGGAIATGIYFAVAGSEVPGIGNAIGFVVGVGGYYITDALVGDDTENLVRETMGEGGCTGGTGPGR